MTTEEGLAEALTSLRQTMATHPRDWARESRDAWLWGILVGWAEALDEVAKTHQWDEATVSRLRQLRRAVEDVSP